MSDRDDERRAETPVQPTHGGGQPPKRLVGFQKVLVQPGQSKPVTIAIDPAATNHPFGVWDYCTRGFVTKPGKHTIYVGNSANNTPHMATLTVGG
jgi:beta-glucosidase